MSDITGTGTTTNQPTATLPTGYVPLSTAQTASQTASDGINSDTFLQLLVAQLQYQDPDDPTDSTQYMAETASFEEVQQLDSLQTSMTSLVSAQQASTATSMLGSQVVGTDDSGNPVSGVVSGVQLTTNGPILTVGNDTLPLSSVTSVTAPGTTPGTSPTPGATNSTDNTGGTGNTGSTGSTDGTGATSTTSPQQQDQ